MKKKVAKKKKSYTLIGRSDMVDFPSLRLYDVPIKVDSGAFTSSFHCHSIIEDNGVLKCQFLDPKHDQFHGKQYIFREYEMRNVKSSNGQIELRYKIKTKIRIFEKLYVIELTLTERKGMKYPVLLGRKFLTNKFLVDTSKTNLSFTKNKIRIS